MTSESLTIKNVDTLIERLIEQCPEKMLLRELVVNAIEAAEKDASGEGRVEIGTTFVPQCPGIPKLRIWNNGPGMNAFELKNACDLSSSINKKMGLDNNYGIGAKVACLSVNKLGMRYRSCRNGAVNEVVIFYDEETGKYSKWRYRLDDGSYDTVRDVTDLVDDECENDITAEWTEVVLFGNELGQNTATNPYGHTEPQENQWIPKYLYNRMFKIPENVKLYLDVSVITRDGGRYFKPLSNRFENFTKHETVILKNDVKIHYFYDATIKQNTGGWHYQSYSGALCNVKPFSCLVYKGEMYEFMDGKEWTLNSPMFGIPFGAKYLSVAIELPNEYPVRPVSYRDKLQYTTNKENVASKNFGILVMENRPQWFIDIIESNAPKAITNDEVRKELQEYLDKHKIRQESLKFTKKGDVPVTEGTDGLGKGKKPVGPNPNPEPQPSKEKGLNFDLNGGSRAVKSLNSLVAPHFRPLWTDEQIDEKNLKDKAAKFNEATNEVFINMQYSAVKDIRETLEARYSTYPDQELMKEMVEKYIEEIMQRLLGMTVVCAKIKKLHTHTWADADIEKAMSPESLSISADNWMNIVDTYYKKLSSKFKLSVVSAA